MARREISQRAASDAASNSDQVEFAALSKGDAPISEGIRDNKIADVLSDAYDIGGISNGPIEKRDIRLDSAESNISQELQRRARLLGDYYPFSLSGNSLVYRGSKTYVYEFCLAITQVPDLKPDPYCQLPRAFERLIGQALKSWLGEDAEFYRTGAPPDGDHPSTFEDTLIELETLCGEWAWRARDPR